MLAGALNHENLTDLFRTLSQKRKHGLLSLQSADSSFEITFISGRIAEVRELGWLTSPAIYERLKISGRFVENILEPEELSQMDLPTLYAKLVESSVVSHNDFMLARTSLSLDMLHSLNYISNGVFQFDARLLEFDDKLSLKLSPGQLLLDFVELETNRQRFDEIMGSLDCQAVGVLLGDDVGTMNYQEEELVRAIGDGAPLEEVMSRVLLSENDFRSVLLALYDRGSILLYPLVIKNDQEDVVGANSNFEGQKSVDAQPAKTPSAGEDSLIEDKHEEDISDSIDIQDEATQSFSIMEVPADNDSSFKTHLKNFTPERFATVLIAFTIVATCGWLLPLRVQVFLRGVQELIRYLTWRGI